LGISPHEIGKKRAFFTLGLGPIIGPKYAVRKSLRTKDISKSAGENH